MLRSASIAQYVKTPVFSKRPLRYGTLAQLARTVRQVARTAGAHHTVVKRSVPIQRSRLEYTGVCTYCAQ